MADSASESDTDGAGGSGGGGSTAGALAAGSPAAAGPGGGGGGSGSAGGGKAGGIVISPFRLEELTNRLASLQQENKVLKIELETYKLKCKALQEENRDLRKASVTIVSAGGAAGGGGGAAPGLGAPRALQHEKAELEQHLEQEQEFQVNKLMKKIKKLENDTISKQLTLEQLRREKIDLENTLEQEQEALVNRLWKRMDKLEAQCIGGPRPGHSTPDGASEGRVERHNTSLFLLATPFLMEGYSEKMAQYLEEERHMREENLRLQRKLQREMERREALCRQLSESESSLEMDDERCVSFSYPGMLANNLVSSILPVLPLASLWETGLSYASHTVGFTPPTSLTRAGMSYYNSPGLHVQHMGPSHGITRPSPRRSNSPDKFKRPTPPPSPNTQTPVQPPPPPPPPPVQPTVQSAASQSATFQHSVHPSSQP
uniref:Coiled-coil domain containing 6 n=1 Tax=Pavo cristatus TaxID=9049 RepID=A0A8C9EW58_PAVCR